jgi:sulfotransferase
MTKTYYFMAGLPRSGSTLLSAILNQNPNIYVSANSDVSLLMMSLHQVTSVSESFNAGFEPIGYRNVIEKLPETFYSHIDKPYIIDKNRNWGTPDNLQVALAFTDKIRIIAPVRPILEILASFVNLAEKNPNNFIDKFVPNYPVSDFRSKNDARCDALMAANHNIEMNILSIASALKPEHQDKFYFVAYDDLITKPNKVIESIYEFLEIPKFEHTYQNLNWNVMPNEAQVYGIPNLHKIRSKIDKSKTDVSVLSEYVQNKYGQALDFIFPSGIKDFV